MVQRVPVEHSERVEVFQSAAGIRTSSVFTMHDLVGVG